MMDRTAPTRNADYTSASIRRNTVDRLDGFPELSRLSMNQAFEVLLNGWSLLSPGNRLAAMNKNSPAGVST